jgi:hypothetical protein
LFYLRKTILKTPSQYKIVNKELIEIETNQFEEFGEFCIEKTLTESKN